MDGYAGGGVPGLQYPDASAGNDGLEYRWECDGGDVSTYLLDTTLLSGTQEVRLESGGVTRDLPQPITITGNRFAFDNAGFAPASGTAGFVAASAPLQTLIWASNQPVSLAVAYTLLGRWDGAGSYVVLGGTGEKSLAVNVGSHTSMEWKAVAQWEGQEFVSSVRTLMLATVAGGPTPVATAGGQTTVSPWVDLSWAAVPGATVIVVYLQSYGVNLTWTAGNNADYYDIFRSTDGGALAWAGRSFATGFADGSAAIGASVRYVVRSRNDNGYADSAQTAALTAGTGFQLYTQGAGLSGNKVIFVRLRVSAL